jgi:O-antigen/teichoic acid export membrane protein
LDKFDFRLFVKDSLYNILIGAFISLSGFYYNWVYVGSLGLEDYGTLVTLNSYSAILVVILSISNQSLFSRLMTEELVVNNSKLNIFTFFVFQVVHTFFVYIVWRISIMFLPNFFSPHIINYSNYIFFIAAFNSFSAIPLGYFLGSNLFRKYRFFSGLGIIVLFFLILIFVLNKKVSLLFILRVQFISAFFVALFSIRFIYYNSIFRFDFNFLKQGLKYSLPIFVYTLFSILSDLFIKISLEQDFNSMVLGKYNVILLVSNIPVILATAINSIFIQKILMYRINEKRNQIINVAAKNLLVIVFVVSFLVISYQDSILSIFNIVLIQNDKPLIYLLLSVNSFLGFCWLQISNELAIHKITTALFLASVLSFVFAFFSYHLLIEKYFITGAGLTLILSNCIIFTFTFFYARFKVDLLVKFKPLVVQFIGFMLFIIFYYFINLYFNSYGYLLAILFNLIMIFISLKYFFRLKNKLKL